MSGLVGQVHAVLLAICLLALLVPFGLAQGMSGGLAAADALGASVRPEHPRLLVTSADLPRLHQQVAAYPDEWKRLQSAALSPPEDGSLGDGRILTNTALAYLITGEERYLTNAVALAENICRNHKFDGFLTPEALFGLALAYDWCYSGLTEPQREEIREGMLRMADYLRDKVWRQSDTSNLFVLRKVWPFVYVALALYDDPFGSAQGRPPDPRVEEYLRLASDYLHQNLLPAANIMAGTTGGESEGYGYDGWGYMRPMALTFEAWRTATGEDLFQSCTATRYDARWNIYGLRPFDGRLEHFDDADPREAWGALHERRLHLPSGLSQPGCSRPVDGGPDRAALQRPSLARHTLARSQPIASVTGGSADCFPVRRPRLGAHALLLAARRDVRLLPVRPRVCHSPTHGQQRLHHSQALPARD
jgi:hypothetical protein